MRLWALLLAAGQGSRLAAATGGVAKQFLTLDNAPLYWRSVETFAACARLRGLVLVFPPETVAEAEAELTRLMAARQPGVPVRTASGGPRRQDSVRLGLAALPPECDAVLIHDTARPFATPALINRVIDALNDSDGSDGGAAGVVPGVPVADTIKVVREGQVEHTPERQHLVAVQTPQGFRLDVLRAAHSRAESEGLDVTDDASLLEACGVPVRVVEGEAANRKLTTPEDLAMLAPSPAPRLPCTGYGYDVHRYADDAATPKARPLRLGGEPIPGGPCTLAHSDGDVLLHAVMDAILGCLGEGDIGKLFPDTDPALDNVNSAVLLSEVLRLARERGLTLTHLDATLVAQKPRISPHREAIRRNLARLTGLPLAGVNVKATTEEGLGFTGAGLGIKAVAVVSALRPA